MFHAYIIPISTCFICTLYHFYAFSGTNLLTRCQSASSCFLLFLVSEILHRKYSRNWTPRRQKSIFCRDGPREPEKGQRGAKGPPHHRGARPTPLPRHQVGRTPWGHSEAALPPIYYPRSKNPRGIGLPPRKVT